MDSYDISGFLSYLGGLDDVANTGGSGGLASGGFEFRHGASTYANGLFTSGWNEVPDPIKMGAYDASKTVAPALERSGGWATAAGIAAMTFDSTIGVAESKNVAFKDNMDPVTYKDFGFSQQDFTRAFSVAFTKAFPSASGNSDYYVFKEFKDTLRAVADGNTGFNYNNLADASGRLVDVLAGMSDSRIANVADLFVAELESGRRSGTTEEFRAYSDSFKEDFVDRLTMVRNVANSVVNLWGKNDTDALGAREAGQLFTRFGMSLGEGERIRSSLAALGFVPAPSPAQGEGGTPAGGATTFSRMTPIYVGAVVKQDLAAQGVTSPNSELVNRSVEGLTGDLAAWVTELESARSAIFNPDPDKRGEGDALLTVSSDIGVTPENIRRYEEVVGRFADLPVYFDANGALHTKPGFAKALVAAETSDRAAQIGAVSMSARSALPAVDMVEKYEAMLTRGNFTGGYLFTANTLLESGRAMKVAGNQTTEIGGHSVTMKAILNALASGSGQVADLNGNLVDFDPANFLTSDSNAAAMLNNYIDQARNYASNAPAMMTQLANAVDHGYLYDTNMLTGERTMNGSNLLQLLLATGGIITPIATMFYQAEQERRNTRKNQEYSDRVRAEDREFQERLLKLQLASAETQASIAANSKKAVATGSSRTGVSINSPTQSK